jgi:hypothetical protein
VSVARTAVVRNQNRKVTMFLNILAAIDGSARGVHKYDPAANRAIRAARVRVSRAAGRPD